LKPIRRLNSYAFDRRVLFPAPEADVDEDVAFADLGRLKHLEAEPLLALLVRLRLGDVRGPVVQGLAAFWSNSREVWNRSYCRATVRVSEEATSVMERAGGRAGRPLIRHGSVLLADTAANGHRPNTTTYRGRYA
jgi:hypothetical protein